MRKLLSTVILIALSLAACDTSDANVRTGTDATINTGPAGRQPDEIGSFEARPGKDGPWQGLIVQGVRVEVPAGDDWEVAIITDPCSSDLRKFVILENKGTGARMKVDTYHKQVTAEFVDSSANSMNEAIDRIQGSFAGERVLEEATEKLFPLPTKASCDPSVDIPTLAPAYEVPTTPVPERPEPSQTPDPPNVEE